MYYSAYKLWQRDAYIKAVELHANVPFDLTHQLTFGSYREPGYLWRLPIPFFWGPIAGATSPPLRMVGVGGARALIRSVGNAYQRNFLHRPAMAARKASQVWVVTDDDRYLIDKWGGRAEFQCEVGTSNISDVPHVRGEGEELRLVWSGLHIPRKALPLALRAMSLLPKNQQFHLDILGTGPLTSKWQALSRRLHVEHLLTWHGRLPLSEALSVMNNAHALLHTSISESTSAVVLEALALGLPVICHDACGMQTAITSHCGIKITLHDPETSVTGFCRAIDTLAKPQVYNALSIGALERAHQLTWDSRVARISDAYRTVCEYPQTSGTSSSEQHFLILHNTKI
jgi:glycosyltransferase involved in cell wall biosynthesis